MCDPHLALTAALRKSSETSGDVEPGFTIDLAHKDLSLIVDLANAARVPMPIAVAAREAFTAARAGGFGGQDLSAMVNVLCQAAGIEKPHFMS